MVVVVCDHSKYVPYGVDNVATLFGVFDSVLIAKEAVEKQFPTARDTVNDPAFEMYLEISEDENIYFRFIDGVSMNEVRSDVVGGAYYKE